MSWQRKHSYSRLLNKVLLDPATQESSLSELATGSWPLLFSKIKTLVPVLYSGFTSIFIKGSAGISVWIIRIDIFLASKIEALSSGNRSDMNIPWVLLSSKKPNLFSLNLHFYSIIKNEFAFVIGNPWFSWLGLSSWLPQQDPGAICSLNIQFPRATSYLTKVCP